MPSQLEQTIVQFRQDLLAYDARALGLVLRTYEPIRQNLIAQINQLVDIANANPGADIWRLQRAQDLLAQVSAEMATLAAQIGPLVTTAQAVVVNEAGAYQQTLAVLSATTPALAAEITSQWNKLPTSALSDLVGRLSDGSPLNAWLQQFGAQTAQSLKESLTNGLALGLHPSVVAQQMADTTDVAGSRLAALARTTMLDSFRSASLAQYQENSDLLDGWAWVSAQDDTVCLACIALDGQEFGLDVDFAPMHVNCRCGVRPLIKGVDTSVRETSSEWFAKQGEETQRKMIPPSAWDDFQSGKITLQDFVHLDQDSRWGDRYRQASVTQARINAGIGADGE